MTVNKGCAGAGDTLWIVVQEKVRDAKGERQLDDNCSADNRNMLLSWSVLWDLVQSALGTWSRNDRFTTANAAGDSRRDNNRSGYIGDFDALLRARYEVCMAFARKGLR